MRTVIGTCNAAIAGRFPVAAVVSIALWPAGTIAAERLEARRDQLACGNTVITAQASCYGRTPMCAGETLTFRRLEGSTIIAPHKQRAEHSLPSGGKVSVLDYHITDWSCVAGLTGGYYLAVIMTRTTGGNCSLCEYTRLYHPHGRLIAATLRFDADGRAREAPKARALIRELIGGPTHMFTQVYDTTP